MTTTKRTWSEYQMNVFDAVAEGKTNIAVSAVAGSGKTTTIVEAAKRVPKDKQVLFLAFNKIIANELSERLADESNVTCSTLHAHGLKALKSFKVQVDKFAAPNFGNTCLMESEVLSIDSETQYILPFKKNCIKLYDMARINLVHSGEVQVLYNLCATYNIEPIADEIKVINTLLATAYDIKKKIDFTDMLTLPLQDGVKRFIPKYDIIFIDECQDLSKAQRELMLASLKPDGKFIAVGDRNQAINGFAGASCDSFDLLANIDNTVELPLSVNYRCGKDIIKLAKNIVPQITAFDGNEKGVVEEVMDMKKVQAGDMVLCRKTAPLVSLCLKLLANGRKAFVKGSDIGEGLLNLVTKMKAKNINFLFQKLDKEKEVLLKKLQVRYKDSADSCPSFVSFCDKVQCIEAIAETCTSLAQLKEKIKDLFADKDIKRYIQLSTVHKSKGLEADSVFIILPDCLPMTWKNQQQWELEQELNLKYVAITRAKKNLYIVNVSKENLLKIEF